MNKNNIQDEDETLEVGVVTKKEKKKKTSEERRRDRRTVFFVLMAVIIISVAFWLKTLLVGNKIELQNSKMKLGPGGGEIDNGDDNEKDNGFFVKYRI